MSTPAVSAPQHDARPRPDARRWWALGVIALAQLMVVLDATIVSIALPSAQRDLGLTDGSRQWVVTAYTLAFGGLLLLSGRIADLVGRKRAFSRTRAGLAGGDDGHGDHRAASVLACEPATLTDGGLGHARRHRRAPGDRQGRHRQGRHRRADDHGAPVRRRGAPKGRAGSAGPRRLPRTPAGTG